MDATATRAPYLPAPQSLGALVSCALVSAILLIGLIQAPATLADGDPASDVLLAQNAYYPYQPPVSHDLESTLDKLLLSAEHTRLPLKVAVIGSAGDLGVVPSFFGHPQAYAQFLDREISFNNRPPLLVVMPAGFGLVAAGSPNTLTAIRIDTRHGSDGLVRSAIEAVAALSRAQGHTLAKTSIPAASSGGSGPPTFVLFAAPVGLLAVIGVFALLRDRRDRDRRLSDSGRAGEKKD